MSLPRRVAYDDEHRPVPVERIAAFQLSRVRPGSCELG